MKLGFESFKPDVPFNVNGKEEKTYSSIILGFFTNY